MNIFRRKIHRAITYASITLSFMCCLVSKGQQDMPVREFCTPSEIRTVLFYRSGWELSMPVLFMNEEEQLELRFDYLGDPENNFSFSIQNCTYDWYVNDMQEHYYIEGFNDVPFYDYHPSRNTTQNFIHYFTSVPTDDLKITRSGNYLLKIYDSADPEKIMVTRKFCIAEKSVTINAQVRRPDYENQELLVEVNLGDMKLIDPRDEIKVVVVKNYDWNNQVKINSPPMLRNNILYFDLPDQIEAEGGNEFRYFDTKSTKLPSERVDYIEYRAPEFHYILKPDELKQFEPYFSSTDLNGRFFIEIPDAFDRHTESDYVQVHFKLQTGQSLGTDVYIFGALTDWQTNDRNYMIYNPDNQAYEKTLLLKQGYYNYAYATRDYNSNQIMFDITEGNHDETENDYLIFVYLRKTMSDFDRLVGYTVVNSTGKIR